MAEVNDWLAPAGPVGSILSSEALAGTMSLYHFVTISSRCNYALGHLTLNKKFFVHVSTLQLIRMNSSRLTSKRHNCLVKMLNVFLATLHLLKRVFSFLPHIARYLLIPFRSLSILMKRNAYSFLSYRFLLWPINSRQRL